MASKLKAKHVEEEETSAIDNLFKEESEPHEYEETLDEFINSNVDVWDIRNTQQQAVSQYI